MKNLLFLIMIALAWSCSSSEGESTLEPTPVEPKEYIVSLGMTGEIDIDESPLTKAIGKDLYGVNVYSKTESGKYTNYAYGIFSDKSLMQIKLLDGYTYKFEIRMIKDVVKYQGGNINNPYFNQHFYILGQGYARETNSFSYRNDYIYNVSKISTFSDPYQKIDEIHDKSYYGILDGYKPSENGTIQINMKIAYFGVEFIAEDLTEGSLHIEIKDINSFKLDANSLKVKDIINFKSFSGIIGNNDYSETNYITVQWEKTDGAIVPLIKQNITFKRNVLTTITIKVKDTSINNGMDITNESAEMTKGENITIESGTGLDGNINPVENQ